MMKQQTMITLVEKRFSRICPLADQIALQFDEEDIHQFRVEIKKLRAFLRLLRTSAKNGRRLSLSKGLKKIYLEMGQMRNLQLTLARLATDAPGAGTLLKPALNVSSKKIAALLKRDAVCKKNEKKLVAAIPKKLGRTVIEDYLAGKSGAIRALLHAPSLKEDALHRLRKLLKDMVYNWPLIEPIAATRLPAGLNSPETISPLTALLGDFQDAVSGLALLQKTFAESGPNTPGLAALPPILKARASEKQALRETINRRLETIRNGNNASTKEDAPAHKKDD